MSTLKQWVEKEREDPERDREKERERERERESRGINREREREMVREGKRGVYRHDVFAALVAGEAKVQVGCVHTD